MTKKCVFFEIDLAKDFSKLHGLRKYTCYLYTFLYLVDTFIQSDL